MLHQESGGYNPTPFPAASAGEHDVAATPTNSVRSGTPGNQMTQSARQRMSQQQLLRHSMGGRASYVAGMRSSTAHTTGPDGGHQQLVASSTSPTSPAPDEHAGLYGASANANAMDVYASGGSSGGAMQTFTSPQNAALTAVGEDFVHEVLAMNTMAMEQCYAALGSAAQSATATEEPMKILREAFMRLDDSSAQDLPGPLLDQLKATTLNNMGVVECNRGQPRQALSHFEAARQLEENNDMASPSVALNTCAAYNALRMYDKATAAALEAIDMLRALEAQRQRSRKIAAAVARQRSPASTAGRSAGRLAGGPDEVDNDEAALDEALLLEAATAPQIAESQNAALWGAAWNNLAIAQINTAREGASKDTSEYTNTLTLFQNAMRATQDLLGPQHPMTRAVVETFRSVRLALRNHGAFKQHRTLLRAPLPPVDPREQAWEEEQVEAQPGQTRHNALVKQRQQLTITFRGDVTGGQKLVERVDGTPYPGAAAEAYQAKRRAPASSARSSSKKKGGGKRSASSGKSGVNPALRGMPHSETLTRASIVYGNPHPLLYTPPPPQRHASASAPPSLPASGRTPHPHEHANTEDATRHARPSPPSTSSAHHQQQQQGGSRRPPKHRAQQLSGSARANGSPAGATPALPPITQGKRAEYSQADDDDMNHTTGTSATGVSSVFMHVPPPRPPPPVSSAPSSQPQPMESTAARLQHAKMLLLASPATTTTTAAAAADASSAADYAAPAYHLEAAGDSYGGEQPPPLHPSSDDYANAASINSRGPLTPSPTKSAEENGGHELFQGMWVTADAHYVHRGPRVFGRPVYYTISTTLDVDEDGVSGAPKAANGGTAAAGGQAASSVGPAVHSTLPTLTYSESSSEDEAAEMPGRTGDRQSDGDDERAEYAAEGGEEGEDGDHRPHSADAAEI